MRISDWSSDVCSSDLTLGTGLVHGFVKSAPDLPTPDVQFFFVHASYANAAERILDRQPGMTIGVAQLRPASVGSIHLKSSRSEVRRVGKWCVRPCRSRWSPCH